MGWIFTKYFITAAIVVLVSELAKRSDKLRALVAAGYRLDIGLAVSGKPTCS